MKKPLLLITILIIPILFKHCASNSDPEPEPIGIDDEAKGLPARWADVTLHTVQFSFPNSPTYTSRSLGYIGVTMYESVVHGSGERRSLVGQLSDLDYLPLPDALKDYNWELSLNAGQALILKKLYPHASAPLIARIDSLEMASFSQYSSGNAEKDNRSVEFGRAIAEAVFEWSKADGGHEGYMYHFDPNYVVPVGPRYWTPPLFGQSASPFPLHPYWGKNRTFISANSTLPVPGIIPYSTFPSSENYRLFKEVYDKRKSLTSEEKQISAWWADDPTQTASPPGHSYNLATIAITTLEADMFTAAEAYAKVGISVADSFICCWKVKFTHHSVRPNPYILANIDPRYRQFWPEPPFPAFPSGHATQSAAAATALISVFGNNVRLVDNTYSTRRPDFENIPYRTRTYNNIWETAEECAYSRFLGGIHTRQDNETGAKQGRTIGTNVNALEWSK